MNNQTHHTPTETDLTPLPTGSIQASGWMRDQMIQDYETGFLGCLDTLTDQAAWTHFTQWVSGFSQSTNEPDPKDWWGGETEPVWMDGLVRMAFITQHPPAMKRAHAYIDYLLQSQAPDGYIGVYTPETRLQHNCCNGELWTQSRALRAMLAYYEATERQDILDAVIRCVDNTMAVYNADHSYFGVKGGKDGTSHGLMYVDVLEQLHTLTADERYVDFAEFLYRDFSNHFTFANHGDSRLQCLLDAEQPLVGHTPHVAEHLRVPLWLYTATGKLEYRQAYENGFLKIMRYVVPSGAIHSGESEQIEGLAPTPDMPYEYCGITEWTNTLLSLTQKTGDATYAEIAETVVINAGQGARLADGSAINYFSRDNRLEATPDACKGRLKFSPTHEDVAVCCNPNAGKLMPYYVSNMWMRSHTTLTQLNCGPCHIQTDIAGANVRIQVDTRYPFELQQQVTIQLDQDTEFQLRLRVPDWANDICIDTGEAEQSRDGNFIRLKKRWRSGDNIRITYPASVKTIHAVNGEQGLRFGPLLYAMPMPDTRHILRQYDHAGFCDLSVTPDDNTAWHCQIPKNPDFAPGNRKTTAKIPWAESPISLRGQLQFPDNQKREVELLPMGATVLRRMTWPVANSPT